MCIADADLPVVPKLKDQFAIIEEAHCGKGLLTKATEQEAVANIGSHFGRDKTALFISNSFYFPDLYAKVAFVSSGAVRLWMLTRSTLAWTKCKVFLKGNTKILVCDLFVFCHLFMPYRWSETLFDVWHSSVIHHLW